MIVLKVVTIVSALMLAACAAMQPENQPSAEQTIEPAAQVELKKIPEIKTAIDPDVLFLLMTAEIAGQRGQYALALDGYLRAANKIKDVEVIKRAAKIAVYLQDMPKLERSLQLWMEVDPDNLEAHYLLAIEAIKSGNKSRAIESLDFILARDDSDFESNTLAMLKGLQKPAELALAYQVFEALSIKYPGNEKLYFVQALMDVQGKRNRQAQLKIAKALVLEPNWVKALLLQAQLYIVQGKLAEATELLQRADTEKPRMQIREQIAQLLMQQGRFDEAQDVLQDLIVQAPENNELKFKLALVYLQVDKEAEARDILEALVDDPAYRDRAAFYLGRIEAKARHAKEALEWFDGIGTDPYKYEAGISSILILMDEQRFKKGLLRVQRMQTEYPQKKSDLVLIESEIYSQMQAYAKAFDVLTTALLEDADNHKILYARALIAEKLDKLDVLEDDLKYILEKNPNNVSALNALGYTLADKTNRYAEAKVYLDKAMALKPNDAIIMDSYGWLLFKLNKVSEAYQYLRRAYDLEPQAEIAAHLVDVLWVMGEQRDARAILSDALQKNPSDSLLIEVKERLLGNN
ncbi:tetratricopeptide repeat protein [methanotrophic endosymbiont of Bathymodiolus puteoserpentis (Logatchev)]|uniref:tetratricopeptide repeat protein n=1 Tax=methanotrophic endosymbiont of Bathymodiolus puteoserpentis (Logatchev) TaxID=343235 RepID=UPI0013C64280|nr:tetratricopeptide repeat protein [methanotrophic endosymbiont of Bathymodiolus puteoserpentis (Logatchev)]SHE21214.1 FIG140336: TPR domain protein [methanotrophic endosymbiont of Bathymodiolus puteoserpentis (Logatchev)]